MDSGDGIENGLCGDAFSLGSEGDADGEVEDFFACFCVFVCDVEVCGVVESAHVFVPALHDAFAVCFGGLGGYDSDEVSASDVSEGVVLYVHAFGAVSECS